jgi:hypothetical protein
MIDTKDIDILRHPRMALGLLVSLLLAFACLNGCLSDPQMSTSAGQLIMPTDRSDWVFFEDFESDQYKANWTVH